jgi:hypothetical protein
MNTLRGQQTLCVAANISRVMFAARLRTPSAANSPRIFDERECFVRPALCVPPLRVPPLRVDSLRVDFWRSIVSAL